MRRAISAVPMPRATRGRPARLGAAVCAGVLAFGIYSLSGAAAAKSQPTVSIGKVKDLGNVLVDSKNHTLYTLVDNHQSVACTGACLEMGFVPLTVEPGSKPTAGKGVKGLGVVAGGTQVTENGFPLFLFSADKPHQAMGQGLTTSGGRWHAPTVKVAKKKSDDSNAGTGGVSF
jgi:predicted lipoprotein with Yx(FWY)xxD motif